MSAISIKVNCMTNSSRGPIRQQKRYPRRFLIMRDVQRSIQISGSAPKTTCCSFPFSNWVKYCHHNFCSWANIYIYENLKSASKAFFEIIHFQRMEILFHFWCTLQSQIVRLRGGVGPRKAVRAVSDVNYLLGGGVEIEIATRPE